MALGASAASLPEEDRRAAATLRDQALAASHAFRHVRSLTVEVGHRLAGSPGDAAAVRWALRELETFGLENVRAEPVTVPHWVRGEEEGEILGALPRPVVLSALGGSVATPAEGLEVGVVGVRDLEELAALDPAAVRGKIVFFNRRMERHRDGSGYRPVALARRDGPSAAARLGAVGVLIRSVGTSNNRIAHTGALKYAEDAPRIPAAALSTPDADLLEARLAAGPVRFRLRLTAEMRGEAQSANVIGEVRGRDRPEEIVLLACHLDSWDVGSGAIDDGAGCAVVMEATRRLAALARRPRRTVRVVLFANEEFGLSGSKAYAAAHEAELENHAIAVEADSGAGRVWRLESHVAEDALGLIEEMAVLLAPLGVELGGNAARGGADLGALAAARVPVLELNQDAGRYFDYHHTDNDTLDKIDPKDLDQVVAAYLAVAYIAAETAPDFGRPAPLPAPGSAQRK